VKKDPGVKRLIVVDGSPLLYSVFHTVGHLSTSYGEPTGVRYGFMRALASYEKKLKADKLVIAWDLSGQVLKAVQLTEYKANREQTESKRGMYAQLPPLKDMLGLTKWTQMESPGYEADDIIATLARQVASSEEKTEVVIVSTDGDMLQLVRPGVKVVAGKELKEQTAADVKARYGVYPERVALFKAVFGDKSDNVPAISGAKSMKHSLLEAIEVGELEVRNILGACEEPSLKEFDRNLTVVSLSEVPRDVLSIRRGTRDRVALLAEFNRLEFKSLVSRIDEFVAPQEMAAVRD